MCASVNCSGYFPECDIPSIVRLNLIGVVRRYIAITEAVNEQYRDVRPDNGLLRGSRFHIQTVSKTDVEKSNIDRGAKECSAEPWADVERATEPSIGDLAESREW